LAFRMLNTVTRSAAQGVTDYDQLAGQQFIADDPRFAQEEQYLITAQKMCGRACRAVRPGNRGCGSACGRTRS
jgi:hypothetical protein